MSEIKKYTPPTYSEGKECYIYFYAYHPVRKKMVRKKYQMNKIKSPVLRRKEAKRIMIEISKSLESGWNPFIDAKTEKEYVGFDDACNIFIKSQKQLESSGGLRIDTFKTYQTDIKILKEYNAQKPLPIKYIFQFTKDYIKNYLEYLLIKKGYKCISANNQLAVIHVFCAYLVDNNYMQINPAYKVKKYKVDAKKRTVITHDDLIKIHDYLYIKNQRFLLACLLLYYCFIRPKELTFIKINNIDFDKNTITIDAKAAKNRKFGTVTLPENVKSLMLELGIDKCYKTDYLFSNKLVAGTIQIDRQIFANHFRIMREKLNFPNNYQFYSLKDTGITELVKKNFDTLSIRNQARHHSIAMTNKYVEIANNKANEELQNRKGDF